MKRKIDVVGKQADLEASQRVLACALWGSQEVCQGVVLLVLLVSY